MAQLKSTIVVTLVLLTGGALLTAVAQEASDANTERAKADKTAAEAESAARSADGEKDQARPREGVRDDERRREEQGDRDREREGDRERDGDRDRDERAGDEERRNLERERDDRDRPDRERRGDDAEREHRERMAREHEEFQRHVVALQHEIKKLAEAGQRDQVERLERELQKKMQAFQSRHAAEHRGDKEKQPRMEHVHHAVELLREAARHLHEAGIHEDADEVVEFSEKIARHARQEFEERLHKEDEGRHEDREHSDREYEERRARERHALERVVESHEDRIHRLEKQLNEVREILQASQRRRDNDNADEK